jgi:endonuclease/exonuclease/phosphatase family metal-dependent hydrolase
LFGDEGRTIGWRAFTITAMLLCVGCTTAPASREALAEPIQRRIRAHELATPPSSVLTVATYNVHGLQEVNAIRTDLAKLDHVTVWCLQEFTHASGGEAERVLPPGRWYVATIPLNRDPRHPREWEAQVIASRFPIERVDVWPLDDAGAKRRVALAARVDVNGCPVLVVNTDHEPSMFAWRNGNAVQVKRLVEHLRRCDEDAVIVAGDFNCSASLFRLTGNTAHARRVDAAMANAGFAPAGAAGTTFHSGIIRSHVDRIYVRGLSREAGAIDTTATGSDHFPVWSRFGADAVPSSTGRIHGTATSE